MLTTPINIHNYNKNTKQRKPKIAIILHQQTSSPGRVGQILQDYGYELDIYHPVLGCRLPDTLENHAGTVIFGGPMSANDHDEFIKKETDWIGLSLKQEKPFLGICLGAQMLANHLGGRVAPHGDGNVEIGWYNISPTQKGREIMDWPKMVYHFHREGIYDLPKSVDILAEGETYPTQAFRYGKHAWAWQFHAELTRIMMHRWVVRGAERLKLKGAQPAKHQLDARFLYDPALRQWLENSLIQIFGKPNAKTDFAEM